MLTTSRTSTCFLVPLRFNNNVLTIATCDPQNLTIQDELRTFLGHEIAMVVATETKSPTDRRAQASVAAPRMAIV